MFIVYDDKYFGTGATLKVAIQEFENNSPFEFDPEEHYVIRGELVAVEKEYAYTVKD